MSTTLAFDLIARDRASRTFDHVGDSAGRSSGKLKQWAKVGALAVAGGAVLAGKALIDMTKGAIEDEAAQAVLAKTLQNATGATKKQVSAVEDWITKQGKAKGIADDELRPAISRLATATGDIGKAQKLTSLAMDVSAGSGKSLKQVTEALQKAQNGSLGGLSRLGVKTKDAAGETKSLEAVTKDLANLYGGQAAKAADTNEGKIRRLKLMYDETKETIGSKLLPVVGQLADWFLNKGVPAIQRFGDWFQQKVMPPLRDFAEDMAPKARDMVDKIRQAFSDAQPFLKLVGEALTNVVLPGLKWLAGQALDRAADKVERMGKMLGWAGDAGEAMWEKGIKPATTKILGAFQTVAAVGEDLLRALGKAPGMDWANKAADKLAGMAEKAETASRNIRGIPNNKNVSISINFLYPKGKPTKNIEDTDDWINNLGSKRMASKSPGQRFMEIVADGIEAGGKRLDKVLKASRDRLKDKIGQIRDDMKSMSESIASALNQADFSGSLEEHLASLTGNNTALTNLLAVFKNLKDGASKNYLSQLMQSGNIGLATALAKDPTALATASSLYDANSAMANSLGQQTAQQVMGDKIDKAIREEIGKLREDIRDLPGKQSKGIAEALRDLLRELLPGGKGKDAGSMAHGRGAW